LKIQIFTLQTWCHHKINWRWWCPNYYYNFCSTPWVPPIWQAAVWSCPLSSYIQLCQSWMA
jgi:hypothetical protein